MPEIAEKDIHDWEITKNRYVAFIDIMGFKNMVATLPHEKIYSMMKNIKSKTQVYEKMAWDDLGKTDLIRTTTYSDSIMLYSKDDSFESLDHLISSVSSLTKQLFINEVPHKGGIAFGLMTLDTENSIFFGQPLIDAYLLQEELSFYGIIIHASCEKQIDSVFKKIPLFVEAYLCPLKNSNAQHLTVQPMFGSGEKYKKDKENLFDSVRKLRYNTSGSLRKYIDNTETYLKSIKE